MSAEHKLPAGAIKRLRAAAEDKSMTHSDISEASGVPIGTVQKVMRGATDPQLMTMYRIAAALGQSLDHIVLGIGDEAGDWETQLPPVTKGHLRVPLYEGSLSAGDGNIVFDGEPIDWHEFPTSWLTTMGDPNEMHLVQVRGDSMEPDLRADDLVMVDYSQRQPRESIFAFNIDGLALVKRLRLKGGGQAELVSSNPAYQPMSIKLDNPNLIIGRVVWTGRKLM